MSLLLLFFVSFSPLTHKFSNGNQSLLQCSWRWMCICCCVVVYACLPAVACGVRVYCTLRVYICMSIVYVYIHFQLIFHLNRALWHTVTYAVIGSKTHTQFFLRSLGWNWIYTSQTKHILHTQFHYLRCKIITVYSINFALDFCFRSLPSLSCTIIINTPSDRKINSKVMFACLFSCRGNKQNITPIIGNVYSNSWRWQWND